MSLIKVGSKYGTKIGNIQVFTREGAINAYKGFCRLFAELGTPASSYVMDGATEDMHRLGFTYEELEDIEIGVYKEEGGVI